MSMCLVPVRLSLTEMFFPSVPIASLMFYIYCVIIDENWHIHMMFTESRGQNVSSDQYNPKYITDAIP
jgi:hypothetical protein